MNDVIINDQSYQMSSMT